MDIVILRFHLDLLAERLALPKGAKTWDRAILFIMRTDLEDCTLQTELTGYVDYARWVRYRLLPGIW